MGTVSDWRGDWWEQCNPSDEFMSGQVPPFAAVLVIAHPPVGQGMVSLMTQTVIPHWLPACKHRQLCLMGRKHSCQGLNPALQVNTSAFPCAPPVCPLIEHFTLICTDEKEHCPFNKH